jgi:membrane protein YqaA with SNARE-associated domain
LTAYFRFLLTWWGTILLSALDSSLVFFMPFGTDALVVYLTARDNGLFWLYPLLATLGSLAGAAVTFWIGRKAGEVGLPHLVSRRALERLRARGQGKNSAALALPGLLPPPFPLTPLLLTCGALDVNPRWFFLSFAFVRLVRFSIGAALGLLYGPAILRVLQSDRFQLVVAVFIAVATVGTVVSAVLFWKRTRIRLAV